MRLQGVRHEWDTFTFTNPSSRRGKTRKGQAMGLHACSMCRITLVKWASAQKATCHPGILRLERWWTLMRERGETPSQKPQALVLTLPELAVAWSKWNHLSGFVFYHLKKTTLPWDRFFENINVPAGMDSDFERLGVATLGDLSLRKNKYKIGWESKNL